MEVEGYSAFRHLAEALFVGRWREACWGFMSIPNSTAYFDESRVDASHKFAVVAGFFNTTDMWIEFEKRWKDAAQHISESDIKKHLRYRPSTAQVNPEYEEQRLSDSIILAKVIRDFAFWPVSVILEREKFESLFAKLEGCAGSAQLVSSAYAICSFGCCELLDELASHNQIRKEWTPIKVVFDEGNQPGRIPFERGYKAYYGTKAGSCLKKTAVFEDRDDIIPLKAADTYAWLLSRYKNKNEELPALQALREHGKGSWIERDISGFRALEVLNVIRTHDISGTP